MIRRGIRAIFGMAFLTVISFGAVISMQRQTIDWIFPIIESYSRLVVFQITKSFDLSRAANDYEMARAKINEMAHAGYFWLLRSEWLPAPVSPWWVWVGGVLLSLILVGAYLTCILRRADTSDKFLRGMRRVSPWRLRLRLLVAAGLKNRGGLVIGDNLNLPRDKECQGILVTGSSGAGKTAGPINRIVMDALTRRRGKLIIYDIKGDFTQALAKYKNIHLFAPWDSRSVIFDLANELRDITDCQLFAKACFPDSPGKDSFWTKAPRQVLIGSLWGLMCERHLSWRTLQGCLESESEMLRVLNLTPQGRSCLNYFDAEETKAGILSNLKTELFWVPFMVDMIEEHQEKGTGQAMSLMDWFRKDVEENQPGEALLLGYYPKFEDFSTKLITVLMDMFILTHNEFHEDSSQRRYYILDEIGTLPQISHLLVSGINLLRSKGAVFVLGIQDYASVERVYGQHIAREISNSCATKIFFRMTDAQSKKWVEDTIGAAEYKVKQTGENNDGNGKKTLSVSYRKETRPVVSAGEISALPDSQAEFRRPIVGFLLVAGLSGLVAKMKWKYFQIGDKTSPHVVWQDWPHHVPNIEKQNPQTHAVTAGIENDDEETKEEQRSSFKLKM